MKWKYNRQWSFWGGRGRQEGGGRKGGEMADRLTDEDNEEKSDRNEVY